MEIMDLHDSIIDPNGFELGIRERILLHLYRYRRLRDEYTVPEELTADGISNAIGIMRPSFVRVIKGLIGNNEVIEDK